MIWPLEAHHFPVGNRPQLYRMQHNHQGRHLLDQLCRRDEVRPWISYLPQDRFQIATNFPENLIR